MARKKSIRGWELDIKVGVWKYLLSVSISPLVWRKWLFSYQKHWAAETKEFHLYVGPFHVWSFTSERTTFIQFRLGASWNWVWYEKPEVLKEKRAA